MVKTFTGNLGSVLNISGVSTRSEGIFIANLQLALESYGVSIINNCYSL